MRSARPREYVASCQRAVANADAIEWEELPSLAPSLRQRLVTRGTWQRDDSVLRGTDGARFEAPSGFASPWEATVPAALDTAPAAPTPFREPFQGLVTREVHEPDVFRHFFGPHAVMR